jgi:DnaJ-class molecular chaperone
LKEGNAVINNHFQTLDIARTATDREIEAAYKKLKLRY